MKFKSYKRKEGPCRIGSVEKPKLRLKHSEFFEEIKKQIPDHEYKEWEEDALFFLFLKPEMDLNNLRPENIDAYSSSAIGFPKINFFD